MNFIKNKQVIRHGLMMRENFDFKNNRSTNWFPGHMGKGLTEVHKQIKNTDCVIEVHDARIPFSGRNPLFENDISRLKPHVFVLNKFDLLDKEEKTSVGNCLREKNIKFIFTNCKNFRSKGIGDLVPTVIDAVKNSERYHRNASSDYNIMIIGIPNVGKSSIINCLRTKYLNKGMATPVGAKPGITRSVLEKIKICEDPLIYVRDTPGILQPNIKNVEVGLKLALANTITDHLVGETVIADYLLFRLNLIGRHNYTKLLKLDEPTDEIHKALNIYAERANLFLRKRNFGSSGGYTSIPDYKSAAEHLINAYRKGEFGSLRLDLV